MTNIEEYIVLAGIGNEGSEMLADDTVPVWRVLFVKEGLDKF